MTLEFNEALIAFELQAQDAREVIDLLAEKMHVQGLVTAEYGAQTRERELHHPTGLPTKPFCIAFPHADAGGVHLSALGVAVMRQPVRFQNMADPDENTSKPSSELDTNLSHRKGDPPSANHRHIKQTSFANRDSAKSKRVTPTAP